MALLKQNEDGKKAIDGRLLHLLGNAAVGRFNGGYISAKSRQSAGAPGQGDSRTGNCGWCATSREDYGAST